MLFVLFVLSYDSLPPLPDFSQVLFPEPPLWVESKENYFTLGGYAGDFFGGECNFRFQNFNLSASYKDHVDWDSVKHGSISTSYSVALPHVWFKPSLCGFHLNRNDTYSLLSPELDFSSTIPWAVIYGSIATDLWYIDGSHYSEKKGDIEVIFDRTRYLPHFHLSGFHTDNQLKPALTGKLHIRNFHLAIGSPIFYGFLSPQATIQYLEPKIKLETTVKSGVVYRPLKDYFDPQIPLDYMVPVPEESLKVGVGFNFVLDFYHHYCGFHSGYKKWNKRLTPGEGYKINTTNNVQEIDIDVVLKNQIPAQSLKIENSLHFHYHWSDTAISFLPRYSFYDTLSIHYRPLEISVETEYLSERDGFNKLLSPLLLVNPTVGLRYRFITIFLKIYNVTDRRKEKFDDYSINHRQYAGGLKFNYTL